VAKKIHMKGRILQMLEPGEPMWDYELANKLIREYELPDNEYWYGTIRVILTDLFSGGLIEPEDEKIDPEKSHSKEKLLFKFALTEFGYSRMQNTKLATRGGQKEAV